MLVHCPRPATRRMLLLCVLSNCRTCSSVDLHAVAHAAWGMLFAVWQSESPSLQADAQANCACAHFSIRRIRDQVERCHSDVVVVSSSRTLAQQHTHAMCWGATSTPETARSVRVLVSLLCSSCSTRFFICSCPFEEGASEFQYETSRTAYQ